MAAEKQNKYWTLRDLQARQTKKFTPQELLDLCIEYFKDIKENPLIEEKAFMYEGTITKAKLNKIRAMTIQGLTAYIGICVKTFSNYGNMKKEGMSEDQLAQADEFLQVVTYVRAIIYSQKFEGAAANLLNSNIIIRDLGLVNKEENTVVVEQPLFPDAHGDEEDPEQKD